MSEVHLTYRGRPALASAFAQMLEEEGLSVSYEPPYETRSAADHGLAIVDMTVSGVAVVGLVAAAKGAYAKFKARFPGQGEVDIDDGPGAGD